MKKTLIPILLTSAVVAPMAQSAVMTIFDENFDVAGVQHNSNRFNTGTRRANNGGEHFVDNWTFDQSTFGGIDQVRSSGDPGILANNNGITIGVAYATAGSNGGTQSVNVGSQNSGDDTLPTGAFATNIASGETISFAFDVIDNTQGQSFDYTIQLLLNGDLNPANAFTVATGTYVGVTGSTASAVYTNISGTSAALPVAVTSFNVRVVADNSNGGNDQVGIDDINLQADVIPEPSSVLLGGIGCLALFRRRRSVS